MRKFLSHHRVGAMAAVAVLALLMLYPDAVIAAVQRGLRRCATTVIPSLFPFLVASELLVRSGVGDHLPQLLLRPLCRLFRLSHRGAICCIMGVLCGFPVGMRTAAAYARRGELSSQELGRLFCFCNVPGSAFLINAVGVSLMNSLRYGQLLWLLNLASAAVVGFFVCRLPTPPAEGTAPRPALTPPAHTTRRYGMMSEALGAAASGMLGIVATVLFFGALLGALDAIPLPRLSALRLLPCLLAGALEITSGVCEAASLGQGMLAPVLCAAVVGWGGLSVHYQLIVACDGFALPIARFRVMRLLQALLCGGGMALLLHLGWLQIPTGGGSTQSGLLLRLDGTDTAWLLYALLCSGAWLLIGVITLCTTAKSKRKEVPV
ncbi:MAG: hypothetical protein IJW97_01270 [Clostridia bacterium]|nr:hypothetical protein [Clostridia bacterium]